MAQTRASVHSVNRRKAVTPESPKPGGSWFQVQPEVATKMMAASTSPTLTATLRANRCRQHHPLEQLPQVLRRQPLDKRSSYHLKLLQGYAN